MHAWLCENPIGVEALQWKELPTPEPKAGRGADRDQGREPELSGPADRAEQVPDEAAAALRARLGVRGRDRGVGEGVTHLKVGQRVAAFGGTGGFGTHASSRRPVHAAARRLRLDDAAAFILIYATTHHALIDRAAAEAPAKRCWCWARRRRGHGGDPDRQGARRARDRRGSSDEKCELCSQLGADATINYTKANLRDALKAVTDGKGPDVVYDPVGGDFAEPVFRRSPGAAATW